MITNKITSKFATILPRVQNFGRRVFKVAQNNLERSPKVGDFFEAAAKTPIQSAEEVFPKVETFYDHNFNVWTEMKIKTEKINKYKQETLLEETTTFKDNMGYVLKQEHLTSSEVAGAYNLKSVDANGIEKELASAKRNTFGTIKIKRDFESLDGTKTIHDYTETKNGSRAIKYKVINKEGKVLLDEFRYFKVKDETTAISKHKGKAYKIAAEGDLMRVHDLQTGDTTLINLMEMVVDGSPVIKSHIKKLDAEDLLFMHRNTITASYDEDAGYFSKIRKILGNGSFSSFMHELGHARSMDPKNTLGIGPIGGKREFLETYGEERESFIKAFPQAKQDMIDYFISEENHQFGIIDAIQEAIAESKMLLTTYRAQGHMAARSHYLQRYFPKTIAVVEKLMQKVDYI